MWEFYLTVSEIAFRNLDQMVFQIQLARRKDTVPLTRDYIADWARRQLAQPVLADFDTTRNRSRRARPCVQAPGAPHREPAAY
jgi:cyclopropane-fatty-acyl-phospholipid synthase